MALLLGLSRDPRFIQIAVLSLLYGFALWSGFTDHGLIESTLILCSILLLQHLADRLSRRQWNYQSALISGFSLLLLLRTPELWIWGLAAALVILPKYLLRIGSKHCFNPTNFAITILLLLNLAWVSPGRWGNALWLITAVVFMGSYVLSKVKFYQCSLGFFLSYALLIIIRGIYLQEPAALILHQFSHISLLIFSLLMISDPRTTPNRASHRWLFGIIVAIVSFYLQFWQFEPNAIFYALFFSYPSVWLMDRYSKTFAYQWPKAEISKDDNIQTKPTEINFKDPQKVYTETILRSEPQ